MLDATLGPETDIINYKYCSEVAQNEIQNIRNPAAPGVELTLNAQDIPDGLILLLNSSPTPPKPKDLVNK